MILIAHNIRSLHNVGAIFRSADCFGVERLYLTGFTGAPPRPEIAKVSLGAEDRVKWEVVRGESGVVGSRLLVVGGGGRAGAEGGTEFPPLGKVTCLPVGTGLGGVDEVIERLKRDGYRIIALENGVNARAIGPVEGKVALLLGNETEGIDADVLALCDEAMEIPMPGKKRSLNVSVAAGIALFVLSQKLP